MESADKPRSESMQVFAAGIQHANIQLRIIEYVGAMDFYAYAIQKEFIGIKLNDTAIPQPLSGQWVSGYAYNASEVQHLADSFIGNHLVHGDAAALDASINKNIRDWFNSVVSTFFNAHYKGYSARPANLVAGNNHFDVSISNYSSACSVTFSIDNVVGGAVTTLALVQLTPARPGWAHDFTFS